MNLFLLIVLFLSIGGYWVFMKLKPTSDTVFSRDLIYPVNEMADGITYYKMSTIWLALRSACYGLTPAILIGAASVSIIGDSIFLLFLLMGIVGMFFFDALVERISVKNEGRELHTVVDNVFGKLAFRIVVALEFLFKTFYVITLMYFATVVTASILNMNQWLVLGLVVAIWTSHVLFTSQAIARNIAYIGGAILAIITLVVFVLIWINGNIQIFGDSKEWLSLTSSLDQKALVLGAFVIGIVSPRSIYGVTEITRHARSNRQSNIAVASQRSAQIFMVIVWTVISIIAINHSDVSYNNFIELNFFVRVQFVTSFAFGDFEVLFGVLLLISTILALELEVGAARDFVTKKLNLASNETKSILCSTLIVGTITFGFVLLIQLLNAEGTFWRIFSITGLTLITIYAVLIGMYVMKKGKWWEVIVPSIFVLMFSFASVSVLISIFSWNLSHWLIIGISWAWTIAVLFVSWLILYNMNRAVIWENDHGKWRSKIGGLLK